MTAWIWQGICSLSMILNTEAAWGPFMHATARPYARCTVWLLCLALSACTSQSRKTSSNLDMNHPRYASRECQMALGRAQLHDNIKQSRVMGTSVAVLLSGGALFLPVLAINAGLDTADHLEASDISVYCGGPETPNGEIAKEVLMGIGFGMGVGKLSHGFPSQAGE